MQDLQLAAADGAFPAVCKLGRGTATDPGCFPNIRGEAGLHFFLAGAVPSSAQESLKALSPDAGTTLMSLPIVVPWPSVSAH